LLAHTTSELRAGREEALDRLLEQHALRHSNSSSSRSRTSSQSPLPVTAVSDLQSLPLTAAAVEHTPVSPMYTPPQQQRQQEQEMYTQPRSSADTDNTPAAVDTPLISSSNSGSSSATTTRLFNKLLQPSSLLTPTTTTTTATLPNPASSATTEFAGLDNQIDQIFGRIKSRLSLSSPKPPI
jgi:hypothetical protein